MVSRFPEERPAEMAAGRSTPHDPYADNPSTATRHRQIRSSAGRLLALDLVLSDLDQDLLVHLTDEGSVTLHGICAGTLTVLHLAPSLGRALIYELYDALTELDTDAPASILPPGPVQDHDGETMAVLCGTVLQDYQQGLLSLEECWNALHHLLADEAARREKKEERACQA